MAHAQKPDFVFLRNGRVHLKRPGRHFSRLLAAEVCASAAVMLDTPCSEVVWRVLAIHSIRQFSPSLHLPCVTVCHHISTGLYHQCFESSFPAPGTSFALRPVHATSFRLTALPTCTCRKFLTSIMNPTFHTQGIIFLSDGNPLKKWHIIFPKI